MAHTPDGLEAVVFTADGDMRQALNNLQVRRQGAGMSACLGAAICGECRFVHQAEHARPQLTMPGAPPHPPMPYLTAAGHLQWLWTGQCRVGVPGVRPAAPQADWRGGAALHGGAYRRCIRGHAGAGACGRVVRCGGGQGADAVAVWFISLSPRIQRLHRCKRGPPCSQALCDMGYSASDIITTLFRVVRNYGGMNEYLKLEYIKVGLGRPAMEGRGLCGRQRHPRAEPAAMCNAACCDPVAVGRLGKPLL